MANFNKVYLMGNLTRDPEMRVTPKGTAIQKMTHWRGVNSRPSRPSSKVRATATDVAER